MPDGRSHMIDGHDMVAAAGAGEDRRRLDDAPSSSSTSTSSSSSASLSTHRDSKRVRAKDDRHGAKGSSSSTGRAPRPAAPDDRLGRRSAADSTTPATAATTGAGERTKSRLPTSDSRTGTGDTRVTTTASSSSSSTATATAAAAAAAATAPALSAGYSVQRDLSHVMADLRFAAQCSAMVGAFDRCVCKAHSFLFTSPCHSLAPTPHLTYPCLPPAAPSLAMAGAFNRYVCARIYFG